MKKRDIIILIIVLLIIVVSLYYLVPKFTGKAISPFECIDSDGGQNYYVQGDVENGPAITGADYCYNENQLKEYYCENTDLKVEVYDCPEGCEDGVCISKEKEVVELPAEKSSNTWIWIILIIVIIAIFLTRYKDKIKNLF